MGSRRGNSSDAGADRFTCEDVFRRLDDYIDRALTPEEARLVADHLAECAQCTSEYEFDSQVIEGVREKLRRIRIPADLKRSIFEKIDADRGSDDD